MKKTAGKVMAVMTAAAMAFAAMGCAGSSSGDGTTSAAAGTETASGEIPVVNFSVMNIYDTTDLGDIENAINEITTDRYGLQIDLTYVESGNWQQQSNMLLTGDEADIILIYGTPLITYVKNGQLLALDDYYANASEEFKAATAEIFTEDDVKCTSVNGSIYALPNSRNHGDTVVLDIDEDIAAEYGIEPGSSMTLDEVDEFLAQAHADYPDRYAIVPQGNTTMSNGGWTWDGLGDLDFIGVVSMLNDDTTVKNLFETEEFLEFTQHSRLWYENGYMMADCLSNTETGSTMIQNDRAISCFNNGAYYAEEDFHKDGVVRVQLTSPMANTTTISGMCWAISANSKNPDAAWTMLEALYSDAEVATLLANGIEGQNYILNEDGTASYPEGTDYSNSGYGGMTEQWLFPNSSLGYPRDIDGPNYYQNLASYNSSVQKSTAYGFCFDTTNVIDEYSACSNVMDKYFDALMMGAVDPDEYIPRAIEELKAAGVDNVIAEKQAQFDAWLAEQE
ncbi:MAG: ABC transporter substrate-binding protein [Eubacteriales bacterium]|nr:ABC transporter substrate-binding protein [Eubacteriales bacterium]